MTRIALISALATASALAACAPSLGPSPLGAGPSASFRAADFAWSAGSGHGAIAGRVSYHDGAVRYSCAHAVVILNPETPWTQRRMSVLYGSDEAAAVPVAEVRARTPQAPPGDDSAYLRRTTCDLANRFSFTGLPDGTWYAITVAKPVAGGPGIALMKRVTTHNGRVIDVEL